jgi:hypothetical protein
MACNVSVGMCIHRTRIYLTEISRTGVTVTDDGGGLKSNRKETSSLRRRLLFE